MSSLLQTAFDIGFIGIGDQIAAMIDVSPSVAGSRGLSDTLSAPSFTRTGARISRIGDSPTKLLVTGTSAQVRACAVVYFVTTRSVQSDSNRTCCSGSGDHALKTLLMTSHAGGCARSK